jgi:hypothetical protein
MPESTTALSSWESFYVIVGSSGGALIGLQFVVITLIADRRRATTGGGLGAFATPTVVHLTGALVVSALMSAPWPSVRTLTLVIGAIGVAGMAYAAVVVRRARRQTEYQPVWEDWLWYAALPCLAYGALTFTAFRRPDSSTTLFVIGGAALGLLLIGIHNAWDTVTHIVVSMTTDRGDPSRSSPP